MGVPQQEAIEKVHIDINGVRQGMFVETTDESAPVLLLLHGGLPEFYLSRRHPTGLEAAFTVVWWEQRGAGMSFSRGIPRATFTVKQFIADTVSVTEFLRRRFNTDRIYLMAHSGGTLFGIQAAAQHPELYHAYIGVAQMVNQRRSEVLAYEYMIREYAARGNLRMVRRLRAAPVTIDGGATRSYLRLRDPAMHALGIGTMHDMRSVVTGIFIPSLLCPQYTIAERLNMWRGKRAAGVSALWDEAMTTDLQAQLPAVGIPTYFLHGIFDYTCSYPLATEYFDTLTAPVKGFYTFRQSAHSPMYEEPTKVARIMRDDVLGGRSDLADAATPCASRVTLTRARGVTDVLGR